MRHKKSFLISKASVIKITIKNEYLLFSNWNLDETGGTKLTKKDFIYSFTSNPSYQLKNMYITKI